MRGHLAGQWWAVDGMLDYYSITNKDISHNTINNNAVENELSNNNPASMYPNISVKGQIVEYYRGFVFLNPKNKDSFQDLSKF